MNCLVDVFNYISETIAEECPDMDIVKTFPADLTEFPIARPTVSIGIDSAKYPFRGGLFLRTNALFDKYYGINTECVFKFNICLPKTMSGIDLYSAFDEVANACLSLEEVVIINISAGSIHYDRIMGAIVLEATITLNAELTSVKPREVAR